jgi:hypothetical protein
MEVSQRVLQSVFESRLIDCVDFEREYVVNRREVAGDSITAAFDFKAADDRRFTALALSDKISAMRT